MRYFPVKHYLVRFNGYNLSQKAPLSYANIIPPGKKRVNKTEFILSYLFSFRHKVA